MIERSNSAIPSFKIVVSEENFNTIVNDNFWPPLTDNLIRVGYQNVRGLNTKLSTLYANSFGFPFHIIVFTETWLNNRKNIQL